MTNNLDRRTLLKGMTALPWLSAFQPFARTMSWLEGQSAVTPGTITTVNVLFHGLFAFAIDETNQLIEAVPPKVSGFGNLEHEYWVGSKQPQTKLSNKPAQPYTLRGVLPNTSLPDLKRQQNPVLPIKVTPDYSAAQYRMFLWFPNQVQPLRLVPRTDGQEFFSGQAAPQPPPAALPLVVAFIYKPDPNQALKLDPLPPEALHVDVVDNCALIQFWAEPRKAGTTEHARHGFRALKRLLRNPDLDFNRTYEDHTVDPDSRPIPGVHCDDEFGLGERNDGRTCQDLSSENQGEAVSTMKRGAPARRTAVPHLVNCASMFVAKG